MYIGYYSPIHGTDGLKSPPKDNYMDACVTYPRVKPNTLNSHLIEVVDLAVGLGFVFGEEDAVPRRPLIVLVPPHHHQVVEVLPRAQGALGAPDVNHQVAQVSLLQGEEQK